MKLKPEFSLSNLSQRRWFWHGTWTVVSGGDRPVFEPSTLPDVWWCITTTFYMYTFECQILKTNFFFGGVSRWHLKVGKIPGWLLNGKEKPVALTLMFLSSDMTAQRWLKDVTIVRKIGLLVLTQAAYFKSYFALSVMSTATTRDTRTRYPAQVSYFSLRFYYLWI